MSPIPFRKTFKFKSFPFPQHGHYVIIPSRWVFCKFGATHLGLNEVTPKPDLHKGNFWGDAAPLLKPLRFFSVTSGFGRSVVKNMPKGLTAHAFPKET